MFLKIKKLLAVLPIVCGLFLLIPTSVSAEGLVACSGKIMGKTQPANVNAGIIDFDSHPLPGEGLETGGVTSLTIVGGTQGKAPGYADHAACISETSGAGTDFADRAYQLEGWAWNTNLGFVSFYCSQAGKNPANDHDANNEYGDGSPVVPLACGNFQYGVQIQPVDQVVNVGGENITPAAGNRLLSGYAWNEAFGYIQFAGAGSAAVMSGVETVDASETVVVDFDGSSYEVELLDDNPLGDVTVSVDGQAKNIDAGETGKFDEVYLHVIDTNYSEGPGPHLTFQLEKIGGGEDFTFAVELKPDGSLTGYAWSAAGVWINMSGVVIDLPGVDDNDQLALPGDNYCADKPIAVCVVCDAGDPECDIDGGGDQENTEGDVPEVGVDEFGFSDGTVLADGSDYYDIHLYLREDDLVTPLDVNSLTIKFNWKDTVKINQLTGNVADPKLSSSEVADLVIATRPWSQKKGGVVFKPVIVDSTNFNSYFKAVDPINDPGHYVLIDQYKIRSFAPTTNENNSWTTSTNPSVKVNNEVFVSDLADANNDVWTDDIETNVLILKNIEVTKNQVLNNNLKFNLELAQPQFNVEGNKNLFPSDLNNFKMDFGFNSVLHNAVVNNVKLAAAPLNPGDTQVHYPNGKDGLSMHFAPAISFTTLYANDLKDAIEGHRSIPFTIEVGAKEHPDSQLQEQSLALSLALDYAYDPGFIDAGICPNLDIFFLTKFDGTAAGNNQVVSLVANNLNILNPSVTVTGTAALPAGADDSCSTMEGATAYSTVEYTVSGNIVKYYSSKLPRIPDSIKNQVAVIKGVIFTDKALGLSEIYKPQEVGFIEVRQLRDKIYKSLVDLMGVTVPSKAVQKQSKCEFNALNADGTYAIQGCDSDDFTLKTFGSGNTVEYVLYVNGRDVEFELNKDGNGDSAIGGTWSVVVAAADVYINEDIYRSQYDHNLSITTIGPFSLGCGGKGNIYRHGANVRNIQANMYADCTFYSYNPDHSSINATNGHVEWGSFAKMVLGIGDRQLYIQGSLASCNTLGGADTEGEGKLYSCNQVFVVDAGGIADTDAKLLSQTMDLNYLALMKPILVKAENGWPIDQTCQTALSSEDIIQINKRKAWLLYYSWVFDVAATEAVLGPEPEPVIGTNGNECDGINVTEVYDPAMVGQGEYAIISNVVGDLVPPTDPAVLAKGLDPQNDLEPVYITAKEAKSVLFE